MPPGASSADSDEASKHSTEDVEAACAKFKKESKEVMEANKDVCSEFQRAFLVLVHEGTFNVKDDKWSHKLTCHTELFGKQESIDKAKEFLDSVRKNDVWKNEDQFRPM